MSAFGRSRGRNGVVRGMPMQIASSGSSSAADCVSTLRRSASACATEGGPANAAEAVTSIGREASIRARNGPGTSPNARARRDPAMRSTASSSYG